MKKVLILCLTGALACTAFADSSISNTVGFINQTVTPGFSTFSATPIGTGVDVPAGDYIAGQGTPGDIVYAREGAAWVGYAHSATWAGLNFTYNRAYLYRNNSGSSQNLVIAGDVVEEGTDLAMGSFVLGFNGYGHAIPMDVDLDSNDLTLAADGFSNGDVLYEHNGSAWVAYTYDGSTYGLDLLAGESYLVKVNSAAFDWDYTVGTTPAAVVPQARKSAKVRAASAIN